MRLLGSLLTRGLRGFGDLLDFFVMRTSEHDLLHRAHAGTRKAAVECRFVLPTLSFREA